MEQREYATVFLGGGRLGAARAGREAAWLISGGVRPCQLLLVPLVVAAARAEGGGGSGLRAREREGEICLKSNAYSFA
jgi:hypothetical protein